MPAILRCRDPRAIVGLLGGLMAAGAELGDEVLDAVEAAVMGSDGEQYVSICCWPYVVSC